MEFEQSSHSHFPKKHSQLGNPSTGPTHPKGPGYKVVPPWSSKFALVPSKTPSDLHVFCHQDLKYVLGWQHTS